MASSAQLAALKALFGAVPDATLRTLDKALADGGPAMAVVREMVGEERADRSLREIVFGPVTPLFWDRDFGPSFPARVGVALWAALKAREPSQVALAVEETRYLHEDDEPPAVLDELCRSAALMLRGRDGPKLRADDETLADELAAYFEMIPLARLTLPKLPDWLGRVTDERTAALKIIMRDASAAMPDGAPRLLELFQAHLPEPQLLLRIISVATDRASDRYLADSELARFGDRLLDDVDRRVERIRTYDPIDGGAGAAKIGEDITQACAVLAEFERSLEMTRDGAWGKRVTAARRKLAANVEGRLRDVEQVLAKALPMQKPRGGGRMAKPLPILEQDPPAQAVAQARGLFSFLEATRPTAQVGGYGALRAQVLDRLHERFSDYVDELLHHLNTSAEHEERARALLGLAAEFLDHTDDPKAAQLVRRRAAAAGSAPQPAA